MLAAKRYLEALADDLMTTLAASSSRHKVNDAEKASDHFQPSPVDVVVVHAILAKGKAIPVDVVNSILDYAEYWAHSCTEMDFESHPDGHFQVFGRGHEDALMLRCTPVGLTTMPRFKMEGDERAWTRHVAIPQPLTCEPDARYFAKLVDYPMPLFKRPVRKIAFTITSHDQGWGGPASERGMYKSSWTWFEAGLERFDADELDELRDDGEESESKPSFIRSMLRPIFPTLKPFVERRRQQQQQQENAEEQQEPQPQLDTQDDFYTQFSDEKWSELYEYDLPCEFSAKYGVQKNRMATRSWQTHTVVWSYLDSVSPDSPEAQQLEDQGRGRGTGDGSFVRDLRVGDVVTVWAKARFLHWMNTAKHAKVEIYWAVTG